MRVGLFAPFTNPFSTPEYVAAFGQAAEERGFSSLWVAEHVVLFRKDDSGRLQTIGEVSLARFVRLYGRHGYAGGPTSERKADQ